MNFIKYAKKHVEIWRVFILDLLFPIECLGCGCEKDWLCKECFKELSINYKSYCLNCGKINDLGAFCAKCNPLMSLNGVWVAGDYQNKLLSRIIKIYKYHFSKDLSVILGKFLSIYLQNKINNFQFILSEIKNDSISESQKIEKIPNAITDFKSNIVIPVPLHKKRLKWRGFNQSELLAVELSKNFNLTLSNNLKRIKYTTAQAKLNRSRRLENTKNCFNWQGNYLENKNIILIDDVTTTGSTLNECAKILKQNGAKEVWGLVLAHG